MKLVRLVVLTGVVASWQVSPVMAESLLQSATRLAQQAGRHAPRPERAEVRRSATADQAAPAAESGMSRRKRVLLVVVGLVGVAAGMYAIDHGVVDNTPSSKGTRKD
jgi:hypothetical protein